MNEKKKFGDLSVRVMTAVFLIGFVLACEYISTHYARYAVLFPEVAFIIVGLCAYEYSRLTIPTVNDTLDRIAGLVTSLLPPMLLTLRLIDTEKRDIVTGAPTLMAFGIIGFIFAMFFTAMAGRNSLEEAKTIGIKSFIGALVGFGGAALVHLCFMPSHLFLFWIIAVVAANDTGAYFSGILFGENRLSLSISPGKTIEGTLGGLVCGVVVGFLTKDLIGFDSARLFGLSLAVGVTGQLFDLAKSFVKRLADVKDSGTLLPGHGGFLDRLDGILGGTLAVHLYLALLL